MVAAEDEVETLNKSHVWSSESCEVTWNIRSSTGMSEPRLEVEVAASDVIAYGDG